MKRMLERIAIWTASIIAVLAASALALAAAGMWALEPWLRPLILLHIDERWLLAAVTAGWAIAATAWPGKWRGRWWLWRAGVATVLCAGCLFALPIKAREIAMKVMNDANAVVLATRDWRRLLPAIVGQDVTLAGRNELIGLQHELSNDPSAAPACRDAATFWMGLIILTDTPEFERWRIHELAGRNNDKLADPKCGSDGCAFRCTGSLQPWCRRLRGGLEPRTAGKALQPFWRGIGGIGRSP